MLHYLKHIVILIGFIESNPPQQVAAEGEDVTFECVVIRKSSTSFTVEWTSDKSDVLIFSDESNNTITLPLSLINVTNEDYQTYTCSGRDSDSNEIFVSASVVLSKLTIAILNIVS